MTTYWNEKVETASREELEEAQWGLLQETIRWLYEHVPFYTERFHQCGIKPDDIKSLEDIPQLPFTTKSDLRYHYPLHLCAVPTEEIALIQATAGTTGKPVVVPYTSHDLDRWSECMARALWSAGIRSSDICQNAYGYGLFSGGMGYHYGSQRIGCAIIPTSTGRTERQILFLRDLGTTALFCTPSYALTIAERAETLGVDLKRLPLRVGSFGAEPWTQKMKKEIEERMGIKAYEVYGLTEMMGPGVAFSCEACRLHINEDYFYPEVIDPVTERVLPEWERGELVITALQRQAMPLLRYRTGDITALGRIRCECGRTLTVMERVLGRTDDMLIISGVNVFPSQIEDILLEFEETGPHYQIKVFKKGYLDSIAVEVEAKAEIYSLGKEKIAEVENRISARLNQVIGIKAQVTLLEPGSIPRSEGKAKRVIDERKR
ncbi:MAG: phenylacetate--CoA ligase [Deltaproteobacteria bacterium]|nr:MAG: phenylacetate--CoA ligase [Deltaproteobacteria bacterium]